MKRENRRLSEAEIDAIVTAEANDVSKWGRPIRIVPKRAGVLYLPPATIEKARKLARRKRMRSYRLWLRDIIEDRISLEEKRL